MGQGTSRCDDSDDILWLTPDKPDNISVGRQRISEHLEKQGFTVRLRGITPENVWASLRDIGNYDAMVGTTRSGAIVGAFLRLISGTPLVVDHVDPIRQFTDNSPWPTGFAVRWLEHFAFAVADHVIYVYDEETYRVQRYASSWSQTDLGVDFDRFADPSPEVLERGRTWLEDTALSGQIAVYVGGLEPIYHVEKLLDAVELLEDWSLLILGDGSLAGSVSDRADRRNDIAYPGSVPHEGVPGYLHVADVGVSLVDDPHTLKVLEYGAAGLPVVQLAGRAEARFGDRVEYCDPSPESIASAIERAYQREIEEQLREFASEFDWAQITDDYRHAFKSII
jgi:glycosyltransferase involved in cell wall biosynthesis